MSPKNSNFVLKIATTFFLSSCFPQQPLQLTPFSPDEVAKVSGCSCLFSNEKKEIVAVFNYQDLFWYKNGAEIITLKKQDKSNQAFLSENQKLSFEGLDIFFGKQKRTGDEVWLFQNSLLKFHHNPAKAIVVEAECGC